MKYQNNQLWCECRLVSLWNAYRFFRKNPPIIGTKEYKSICENSYCMSGSCINIEKERKRLGITFVSGKCNLSWIRKNLPVQIALFTKHRGLHSVLVVKTKRNKLLLANYAYGRLYWLSWKRTYLSMLFKLHNCIYSYKFKKL